MSVQARRAAKWGPRFLTEPVPHEVSAAISRALMNATEEVNKALATYGLNVYDIAAPEYRKIIPAEECPIFTALEASFPWNRDSQ